MLNNYINTKKSKISYKQKHFEEATEVGGQVLDDFIHHRIKIMAASAEKIQGMETEEKLTKRQQIICIKVSNNPSQYLNQKQTKNYKMLWKM